LGQVSSSTVRVVIGPPPTEEVDVVEVVEPELVRVESDEVVAVEDDEVEEEVDVLPENR